MTTTFETHDFPKRVNVGGLDVTLRPLQPTDRDALQSFVTALPAADRHFMKDDVTDPAVLGRWAENIDSAHTLSLVAITGHKIVADAVLLRHRSPARRLQAEVRVNVSPEFQGKGLGTTLIRALAQVAWDADIETLEFELVEGFQSAAIDAVRAIGAYPIGTLEHQFRGPDDEPCDVTCFQLALGAWFRF